MNTESEKTNLTFPTEQSRFDGESVTSDSLPQTGRKNAKKTRNRPNLYAGSLDETGKRALESSSGVEGLDDEITLMRTQIKTLLENDPENLELIIKAIDLLNKMIKTRYAFSKKPENNLGESIRKIITEIGVPLGVAAINKKLE